MRREEKIDTVIDLVCRIIRASDSRISDKTLKSIIVYWMSLKHLDLGFQSPMELIDTDYPRVIVYLNAIHERYKNYSQVYDH